VAQLRVDGSELFLELSTMEKAEAVHGNVRVPLTAVQDVRLVDDPWPELRGIRAPGTGIPGKIAVGTRRGGFGKDFAVVHGKGAAVVVELAEADFQRLVVTDDSAADVVAAIRAALPRPS
jgi:hypothetical protein